MPTRTFNFITSGTARNADLVYPPASSIFTQSSLAGPERSYDAGLTQYRIKVTVAKASISDIPAGALSFVYNLKLTVGAKNNADTRELRIKNYGDEHPFWSGITAADYVEDEFAGDLAAVALSALSTGLNTITLSGLPDINSGNVIVQMGISGGSPTGLNDFSITAMALEVTYSFSATPSALNIDGDPGNGISLPRADVHRFGWATGQISTRFELQYKRESDGGWTTVDQSVSNQYWDAPANTFTSGADNNWRWRVRSYDVEDNFSAWSVEKTFTAVGTLAAPTVGPSGTISTALPQIVMTGMATHTREQFYVYEGATLIYSTTLLVQTSGLHTLDPALFRNGEEGLLDGHTYTLRGRIVDSTGAIGEDDSSVTVAFTPPNQPVVVIVDGSDYLNINYENPAGGATVDSVDIRVSEDYDPITETGTWRTIATGLDRSAIAVDPNFKWYECQSGRLYWVTARAWAGPAYIDADPVNGTLQLDGWLYLHDPDDPEGTIIRFEGYRTGGGSESTFTRTWSPKKTVRTFLNSAEPSSDNEVTTAGVQVGVETIRVSVMNVEQTGADAAGFRDFVEAMMKTSKRLCLRGHDTPLGLFKYGQITGSGLPSRDGFPKTYITTFEFTVTR